MIIDTIKATGITDAEKTFLKLLNKSFTLLMVVVVKLLLIGLLNFSGLFL
jgi:hypothetical protein